MLSTIVMFIALSLGAQDAPEGSSNLAMFTMLIHFIGLIFYLVALVNINRIQIKRAVLLSVIGSIIRTIEILFWSTMYPSFYLMLIPYIAIWVLTGYLVKYINFSKCERCGNIFTTDRLVECHQCERKVCENCLDKEYNVCTACKTNYVMKLEVAEKSKPQQTQSQQVVIQQAPQTPSPQTPTPETSTNMKHCIHCGNMIKLAAKFCDKCGKEQ